MYLSACSTARTGPALLDEAIHLTLAFQLAGYRHVVGMLWSVSDDGSVSLVDDVYAAVKSIGGDAVRAVRAARSRGIGEARQAPVAWRTAEALAAAGQGRGRLRRPTRRTGLPAPRRSRRPHSDHRARAVRGGARPDEVETHPPSHPRPDHQRHDQQAFRDLDRTRRHPERRLDLHSVTRPQHLHHRGRALAPVPPPRPSRRRRTGRATPAPPRRRHLPRRQRQAPY
ncbi:CHAT domain-containing protein [Pseudofrankia sp. BMG5.37]|uniref:CHAT domain-containing protein n=1 Tax=Pseudofrankia sp. BMG5.36 TaxID=1834512 RepID=UPI001F515A09|nr:MULTISPECIES: CHAT domain-containing protein [unclassified Pseudofrankia]MDT3442655.1 CHAT domain-containing protein [Pseudofrankia sp. BMG5.37]